MFIRTRTHRMCVCFICVRVLINKPSFEPFCVWILQWFSIPTLTTAWQLHALLCSWFRLFLHQFLRIQSSDPTRINSLSSPLKTFCFVFILIILRSRRLSPTTRSLNTKSRCTTKLLLSENKYHLLLFLFFGVNFCSVCSFCFCCCFFFLDHDRVFGGAEKIMKSPWTSPIFAVEAERFHLFVCSLCLPLLLIQTC